MQAHSTLRPLQCESPSMATTLAHSQVQLLLPARFQPLAACWRPGFKLTHGCTRNGSLPPVRACTAGVCACLSPHAHSLYPSAHAHAAYSLFGFGHHWLPCAICSLLHNREPHQLLNLDAVNRRASFDGEFATFYNQRAGFEAGRSAVW